MQEIYLKKVLVDMIADQDERSVKIMNKKFRSLNEHKKHLQAQKIKLEDFKEGILLQVNGMFNPSLLPSTFKCEGEFPVKSECLGREV